MKISSLGPQAHFPIHQENVNKPADAKLKSSHPSFGDTLRMAMRDVNSLHNQAGTAIEKMVAGEDVDLHEVMIAVEKAKTSFDLLMEVRNKTLEAYRELMRMQM